MKTYIFLMTLILNFSCASWAATGKVSKVQGNRAIVQFNQTVKPGDLVQTVDDLGPVTDEESGGSGMTIGTGGTPATRKYAFQYGWQTASLTVSGTTSTAHAGTLTWWFNYHEYELAPILQYTNTSTGSSVGVGGIGQYDFIKNNVGVQYVVGAYAKGLINSNSNTTGVGNSSSTTTTMGLGGSFDWFPFIEHAALNISLEYDTISNSVNSTPASQLTLISGAKLYF